ncbi:MAG: hypothetical protein ACOC46_01345, partial [Pirellulales bacterium]
MNAEAGANTSQIAETASPVLAAAGSPGMGGRAERAMFRRLRTVLAFVWKYLAGAVLCLNPLTSVLVVGWTYRLAQRSVLRAWWRRSARCKASGVSFVHFVESGAATCGHARAPNWIVAPPSRRARIAAASRGTGLRRRAVGIVKTAGGSLWLNARIGGAAIFNTWVLTLPACLLWLFAWHGGWNNSFHKGYEQWWVGPLTGWLGVGLFLLAMLYVPMAQARQAVTGEWRSFYHFRLVRTLIRRRPAACVALAALYVVI